MNIKYMLYVLLAVMIMAGCTGSSSEGTQEDIIETGAGTIIVTNQQIASMGLELARPEKVSIVAR